MTNEKEITRPRNYRNLEKLSKQIKPVMWRKVDYGDGKEKEHLFYVQTNEGLRSKVDGKSGERAYGLEKIAKIYTYYKVCGIPVFDITLQDVLPQIPEGCIDEVVAFEKHDQDWYNGYDYAVARITLYSQDRQKYAIEVKAEVKRLNQQRETLQQKCNALMDTIKDEA